MERRNFILALGSGAILPLLNSATTAEAAVVNQTRFTIRNGTNQTIFAKVVGHTNNWNSQHGNDAKMGPTDAYNDDLFVGERMIVIWDDKGNLLDCAKFTVGNVPGILTITLKGSTIKNA